MAQQTWFITGTSSGFGRLLTEKLLARGDRVAATLRQPDRLSDLQALHGDRLLTLELDVTDAAGVRDAVAEAWRVFRRVGRVVNNAGYGLFGAAEELSDAQIAQILATNLQGSIHVIRAALPRLRAQGGGRILQVSSEGGQIAYPNFSVYHASKWGIEGFIEAVRQEVAPFGIEFTIVEPGPAGTSFGASLIRAPAMMEYDATPSGDIRRALEGRSFALRGDPSKMVDAMIACADCATAPRRLVLGAGSYDRVRGALLGRVGDLEAQRAVAFSTEVDG